MTRNIISLLRPTLLLLLLLFASRSCLSISCYFCGENLSADHLSSVCTDGDAGGHLVDCGNETLSCFKSVIANSTFRQEIKGCALDNPFSIEGCLTFMSETDFNDVCYCSIDSCNGSNQISSSSLFIAFILFSLMVLKKP